MWLLLFFYSLFIFCGHSTREPAYELFYSAGLHRNRCYPQPTQEKIGRGFAKKMQVNGPKGKKKARKKSPAVSVACMTIY